MKLCLPIALAAITVVSADNYNYNAQNQNEQNYAYENYEAEGYAYYYDDDAVTSYNASNVNAYDQQYYSNYDSSYVNNMNQGNGNFQYYDSDGQYDANFSNAGYYDDYGAFHYYNNNGNNQNNANGDDGNQLDEASASAYYKQWQNSGGANGFYDSSGTWQKSKYESVPCQSYSDAQNYYGDDGDDANAAAGEYYNAAWASSYNSNNNQNIGSSDWNAYLAACQDSTRIRTDNCDNSVVQVTNVTILCDSPYRQYFSQGGHMASELCEYGDQATVMVFFEVTEDLDWMQNLYMTFGVYAGKKTKELLWAVRSVEVCNTFVGKQCTHAGRYAFAFQVTFDYGQMSDRSLFVPLIEMGFSTRPDEGYNIGGVNINCKFNSFYQQYDPWYNGKRAHSSQLWGAGGLGKVAGKFGILVGVLLLGIAFGLFTWSRKQQGIEYTGYGSEYVARLPWMRKKEDIEFQGNADELIDDKEKTLT